MRMCSGHFGVGLGSILASEEGFTSFWQHLRVILNQLKIVLGVTLVSVWDTLGFLSVYSLSVGTGLIERERERERKCASWNQPKREKKCGSWNPPNRENKWASRNRHDRDEKYAS